MLGDCKLTQTNLCYVHEIYLTKLNTNEQIYFITVEFSGFTDLIDLATILLQQIYHRRMSYRFTRLISVRFTRSTSDSWS